MERDTTEIHWSIDAAEKGGFAHFTLKEIYEQPHAIQECLRGRVDANGDVTLAELDGIARPAEARSSGSTSSAAERPATRPTWRRT